MAQEKCAYQVGGVCTVRILQGNLVEEKVDAIVNAANEHLSHGGGVAGAIVRAGGQSIQDESNAHVRQHGPVATGSAALTGAGSLPCRVVIHAVGPIWGSGDEHAKLASAVESALRLADECELTSISLPAISSGIFGFPKDDCATVMLSAIEAFVQAHADTTLREVRLCNLDDETADIFEREARARSRPHAP
jgi:O-acetyl-ADP-ribose deacetylase (regulator of RNase III)